MFAHLPAYVAVLLILAELVVRTFGACVMSVFYAARLLCSPMGAASLIVGISPACIAVAYYEFIWRLFQSVAFMRLCLCRL